MMEIENSPLSLDLREALNDVDRNLHAGFDVTAAFAAIPAMFEMIEPESLTKAEGDIVHLTELYRRPTEPSLMARFIGRCRTHEEQLRSVANLEHLFVFHRDGRLREAALRKFDGPISSPFMFVALAWRLNDWVAEVRAAAAQCARRCFPQTSPEIIARAALVLLRRRSTWGRWSAEQELLDITFARPEVVSSLASLLIRRPIGPNATLLRTALRDPAIDFELPRIAADAIQPATRAVAFQALIAGKASWPDGWHYRWIDKSMGRRRAETVFATRPITIDVSPDAVIRQALADPSGVVRSVAMSGLIHHREVIADASAIARNFLQDPARAVRERAEFLLKEKVSRPA